jgi:hypothetical protein
MRGAIKVVSATMLILLAAARADAQAASPVQDYLATRDAYLTQFKGSAPGGDDAATAAHDRALGDLAARLRSIVGPTRIEGFPAEGKINLDSLAEGDISFGLLDGLVYAAPDARTRIVVTTRELLDTWLAGHRHWWNDKNDMPPSLEPALKSEAFYTQALYTDAYFFKFVDLPVTRPAGTTFAFAALVGRAQDTGLQTPDEIVVTLLRGGRAYVIVAPAAAKAETTPQCAQGWKKAEAQAEKAESDKGNQLREDGYRAYRSCFAAQAPRRGYFPALIKQAQTLIDVLPK